MRAMARETDTAINKNIKSKIDMRTNSGTMGYK